MGIINEHFTMPGKDFPPQEFMELGTQQGQINWLAQFLMSVNNVFDNVSGTVTTLEPNASAYVEIEFDDENNSATFDFYIPQGQTGAPGHLESLTATAQTLAAGQSATATVVFDEATQSAAFTFGIPTTNPTDTQVTTAVNSWLTAHPEATTTVQDNSITNAKLVQSGGILAEVEDIRTGYEGTEYASAGDAVRGQIENLKESINNSVDLSDTTWVIGSLDAQGYETTRTDRIRSGFLKVTIGTRISMRGNPECLIVAAYDDDFNFISSKTWENTANEDYVESGTSYIRILLRKSNLNPTINDSDIDDLVALCSVDLALEPEIYGFVNDEYKPFKEFITKNEITDEKVSVVLTQDRIINANHAIVSGVGNVYCISDKITVYPGEKYKLTAFMNWNNYLYCFYDASDTAFGGLISDNSGTGTTLTDYEITIPNNATSIRLGVYVDATHNYRFTKESDAVVANKLNGYWSDKTWVCVGDSLTAVNATATNKYHDLISAKTGIYVVNYGKDGTGYGKTYSTNNNFANRVLNLANISCNVITIFGSFNDMTLELGTADDTGTSTVGGWMNTTFDNLYATKPFVSVGVILPTPWWGDMPTDPTANPSKYCDMLLEICRRRSIPVLDLFHNSNLHPDKSDYRDEFYANADGVHPNDKGHAKIAPMIHRFLEQIIDY